MSLNTNLYPFILTLMKTKKLLGVFLWIFALTGITFLPNAVSAQSTTPPVQATYWEFENKWWRGDDSHNEEYNPSVAGKDNYQNDNLIKTIRTAINWVLWILSFIALLLCLWWGFQMMTSGWDQKKYESGLNILKWAAIGLAVIAVSWLIVSLIFYVINHSIIKD